MSKGDTTIGTTAIRAKRARNMPFFSILRSLGSSDGDCESMSSRFFTREDPKETRMRGIATAPAESSATNKELWRKPDVLKKRSSWSGVINATMTDARTAHNGGFMRLIIRRGMEDSFGRQRCEDASIERILSAGNDVSDSRESECMDRRSSGRRRSSIAPNVEMDLVERLVDM
jgi:hypothetical protein